MNVALPTGVRGRALALGVATILLAVFWIGIAAPIFGWYSDRQDRLDQQRVLAQRMAALADMLPELRDQAKQGEAPAEAGGSLGDALLDGATDALAAASLGSLLQEMASEVGARISSSETLPAEAAGQYRAIGLRLTTNAPWPVLARLLEAIAHSDKPLLVDNLQLRGPPRVAANEDAAVDAVFTVIGYRAGTDTKETTR